MQRLSFLALSKISASLLISPTLGQVNAFAVKLVMHVVTHPSQSSGDWDTGIRAGCTSEHKTFA